MTDTLFSELASLCEKLAQTKKRKELSDIIGNFLRELPIEEIPQAINLILARAAAKPLDLSVAAVFEVIDELVSVNEKTFRASFAEAPDFGEAVKILFERGGFSPSGEELTIKRVFAAFEDITEIQGPGAREKKKEKLLQLFRQATPLEAKYLAKNVIGERRHGVDEGMILEALATAFHISMALLRRSYMLMGDIGEVAKIAITEGAAGFRSLKVQLFRPIKPMLAQMAPDVADVFDTLKVPFALEYKLDGARIQIHKQGGDCRLFSRNLAEVTASLPDIVADLRQNALIEEAIFDGEVIAITEEGHPLPFQALMRRLGRVHEIRRLMKEVPARLFLFDILYKDGEPLIDIPYQERWQVLESTGLSLVPRIIPENSHEGKAFFNKALEEGFEGLVAKALSSAYMPGARGKAWFKVKKVVTLDLVIVAADWGYGRRQNWLSNYHLAARDERTGEYFPVGKTYKGLTDKEFEEMTQKLLNLKIGERRGTVFVEPRVVVEILFSDVQKSPHYRAGYALRFARIARIREDKSPLEIDSLQTIARIYREQQRQTEVSPIT